MAGIVLAAINAKWIHSSLALRLLKANLGSLESHCEIIEFTLRQSGQAAAGLEERCRALLAAKPLILGLSVSIWNHIQSLELLAALEKRWEQKPFIVLGGPELFYIPEDSEIFRYAGFVIRGEGEKAFAKLCGDLLSGKKPPRFINAEKARLAEIKTAYHLYNAEDLERKLIYVEASRDCPFACAYCQSAVKEEKAAAKVREFPLEPFFADMEKLLGRMPLAVSGRPSGPARTIKFLDRSFNANIPRALAIMEFFLAFPGRQETPAFQLHFEMLPSLFPPELKATIARFLPGTLRLELGIQSLNSKVCAVINRPSRPGQELENLAFLRRETGAIIHADLIAGLPGEDFASFGEGFDRLWTALSTGNGGAAEIQLGLLKGLPGTPVRNMDRAWGMVYSPGPPYDVLETGTMSGMELEQIKNYARFWELVVNRAPFPELLPLIAPAGGKVFGRFMDLSGRLYGFFGRNWGLDRKKHEEALKLIVRDQA